MKQNHLLLVEDAALQALDYKAKLNEFGYTVTIAYSGDQAIRLITPEIDLVLMDIDLGENKPDGIETAAEIRKSHNAPIVYLTAHERVEFLQRAEKTEPYGYIVKTVQDGIWRIVIQNALARHRAEKQLAARLIHDLKWPLKIFQRYMDLLQLGPAGITQNQFLAIYQAVEDAASISSFLEQSLVTGNIRASQVKLRQVYWPDVFNQIDRMSHLMNDQYESASKLSFRNSFDGPVMLDELLVKRAITNLVINSLTVMQKQCKNSNEGIINISSIADGNWLVVILEDNACGLKEDAFEYSSGFGLGICKQIVEEGHRGEMLEPVANQIGGTTFTLKFPLKTI